MTIKVVIIDDSALMRKVITNVLSECHGIDVVETARNGVEAMKIIEQVKPDIVTLDVEMPVMDGLETLKAIKENFSLPVIMLSSKSNEETTIQALEYGAEDFIEKPVSIAKHWTAFKKDLERRILVHFKKEADDYKQSIPSISLPNDLMSKKDKLKAIVIGASTGGPRALVSLIQSLPEDLSIPVFIVQHMPEGFTASFAKRLNDVSSVKVVEASHGEPIIPGTVYLAPGGKHMTLSGQHIKLDTKAKLHSVRPAVDYLFYTAVDLYDKDLLGIILTGMGQDGADGCRLIKEAGGYVITQDQASSTVYGMPRVVAERGFSDQINSLSEIGDIIKEMTR